MLTYKNERSDSVPNFLLYSCANRARCIELKRRRVASLTLVVLLKTSRENSVHSSQVRRSNARRFCGHEHGYVLSAHLRNDEKLQGLGSFAISDSRNSRPTSPTATSCCEGGLAQDHVLQKILVTTRERISFPQERGMTRNFHTFTSANFGSDQELRLHTGTS